MNMDGFHISDGTCDGMGFTFYIHNHMLMKPVTIAPDDSINYDDFVSGNSVQLRVKVDEKEASQYKKGTTVDVVHENEKLRGKIVSEPLVVSPSIEHGEKTLSLIIEKV
jgi:hypothetical protein